MTNLEPGDAISFYEQNALEFHESYARDRNRQERLQVWRQVLKKYVPHAELGYDLGCGSGMLTVELAARTRHVIGVDGSQAMLDIAGRSAIQRGLQNIAYLQSRLPPREASEFAPGEVVISSSAIEYLDSIEEALRFVRSILLPKGLFIFSVSNRDSISRRIVRIVYRLTGRPEYFGLVRHFLNEKDFRSVLCNSGFEYVDHLYFGGRDRLNAALSMLFPVRMSTNMVLIIAQRQA